MATEVLPDDEALRRARRERALAQMEAHDLDALILGREANARYLTGAQRLWTAGTRPFGPGCVVVRATGGLHLVSTWDEGIPDDIAHEHLAGITWNPQNTYAWLAGIEGMAEARRIGTDALSPGFPHLFGRLFPDAELVDAEPALLAARRVKTPEEVDAIRASIGIAEAALAVAVADLRPGVTGRQLTGAFMDAMARRGVTTPSTQDVARVTSLHQARRGPDAVVQASDLVAFDAGVVAGGYIGEVGRTWPAGEEAVDDRFVALHARGAALLERLVGACRAGAPTSDLLAAYDAAGEPVPPVLVASGLGLGFDLPVVTGALPGTAAAERFESGMVLVVTAQVADDRQAVATKEAVLVTADQPEVLTASPHWAP